MGFRLRNTGLFVAVQLMTSASVVAAEASEQEEGWWQSAYLLDYGLVAAGGAAYFLLADVSPNENALIGPAFRPEDPESLLADESLGLNYPHARQNEGETVPASMVGVGAGLIVGALGAQELFLGHSRSGHIDAQRLHDTMLGFAESVALTMGVTEVLKVSVGRLRPDFRERVRHHGCSGGLELSAEYCRGDEEALDPEPAQAQHIFEDGRRSFPSGHASSSFVLASYGALVLGGHYVWGEHASSTSRVAGIVAQSLLLGAATFVTQSRVGDGRHNPSDVLAGAVLGLGIANAVYWRHFDLEGRPRRRGSGQIVVSPVLGTAQGAAVLGVQVRH